MQNSKVLIAILAYNAESHIEGVLSRIPAELFKNPSKLFDVYIFDDASKDNTTTVAKKYLELNKGKFSTNNIVERNIDNLGYGGNQKKAYNYAIENGYDAVVMLHGDGQYAPELLGEMAEPILSQGADCVLGSRMMNKKDALKGGMPLYKFFGNIFLTTIQNLIMRASITEYHTGYRAYSINALKSVPFNDNSNNFEFDTDIIIQMIDNKKTIKEIAIPTFYGDEVCNVKVIKYGIKVLRSTLGSKLHKLGFLYRKKFEYNTAEQKLGYKAY
jgi:glycosyltransferase involved in cell wall biosynthesis